jgi:peptidoglycan/xylan/chitin deacetylase (PgdA/CDA1 family)
MALTPWVKRAGAWALLRSGAIRFGRPVVGGARAIVLLYHRVNDANDPFFPALPVRHFRAQLDHVAAHYRVDTAESVLEWLAKGAPGPPRVAITFDDGYPDTLECVLPELERRSLPATLLLSTSPPETGKPLWTDRVRSIFKHAPARRLDLPSLGLSAAALEDESARLRVLRGLLAHLKRCGRAEVDTAVEELERQAGSEVPSPPVLDWEGVRRLARGPFRIGAHTHRHYILRHLADDDLRAEIGTSIRLVRERVGTPVTTFAYPNGRREDYDARSSGVLAELDVRFAFTAIHAFARPGTPLLEVPRLSTGIAFLPSFAVRMAGLRGMDDEEDAP